MPTTSTSLLQRLQEPRQEHAWERFVDLYAPLLMMWARQAKLPPEDAADHVQEVFTHLVRILPESMYDRHKGSFRVWLRTVFLNKLRDRFRRQPRLMGQADGVELAGVVDPANHDDFTEQEYRCYLVRQALELMKAEFETTTWQACWELVVNEQPASDVARKLGITRNAVYLAKLRVLRRLRQELTPFLD